MHFYRSPFKICKNYSHNIYNKIILSFQTQLTAVSGQRLSRRMDQGRRFGGERTVSGGGRMHRGQRGGRLRALVSEEIMATIIDQVVNHGLSLREVGSMVQPILQPNRLSCIDNTFSGQRAGKMCIFQRYLNYRLQHNALFLRLQVLKF